MLQISVTNKVKENIGFIICRQLSTAEYFDSFETEHIPQDILNKIKDKSITHNIFRIPTNDSVTCGFYCIVYLEYMITGKPRTIKRTVKSMTNQYISTLKTNMAKGSVRLEFRLKRIGETKNYLLEEIKSNDLINEKPRKSVQSFELL